MTSIEWLKQEFQKYGSPSSCEMLWSTFDELIEEAQEMERKQTIDFANSFAKDYIGFDSVSADPNAASSAEYYYNQINK
jgi:hypothetical protein